ncbi:magnesium/cobalt transporter CorA [Patescibacteria group bacterium]|nr:magnesium/cobalt transporter CorA [Patescibacteria group bacterium]
MKQDQRAREIKTNKVKWLHFVKPSGKQLENLKLEYKFHPLDIEDCISPAQRPKLDEYENYLFLILTFPYYDAANREIQASEVNFFIGPDYLITVTDGRLTPLLKFFEQCQINDIYRGKFMNDAPTYLLYEIINRLQLYCYPMLDHVAEDINDIQKIIFGGYEKKMVKEILIIKRNIVNLRKIMQAHKNVIRKLLTKKEKYFIPRTIAIYFNNTLEQTKDIWDILESLKENIDALHNTNESLISFRLNDIMKILTIITVILLPVNLVASIFGMNTPIMPLVNRPHGFWIILGLMAALIVVLITFFKKKKFL